MIGSILSFVVVLSLLIIIHEAGHFFAARRFGIWVEEFGLGLPPRLWGKKIGETIFSFNWLPFGGYVRLHGENLEETITKPERAFLNKSKSARAVVICAGVFMNLVLGIVAFAIVYSFTGVPRDLGYVKVLDVAENSPASQLGLVENDIVREVDGIVITENDQFISLIEERRGEEVTLKIEHEGVQTLQKVTPRKDPPPGEGSLGVAIGSSEMYFAPLLLRPVYGVYYGFGEALFWGKAVLGGLGALGSDLTRGQVPKDIAGPVGIYKITSEVAVLGILPLINFLGVLSVNLAVINILPIPALDGGRLIFILIEAITKKRVTPKIEATIHGFGMAVLLILILIISVFDVKHLAEQGSLPGFLQQFFN